MDLIKMIDELRAERAAIDDAVQTLERLARTSATRRRGRPPSWMTVQLAAAEESSRRTPPVRVKTRTLSAEVKAKMAESQRKRWEAYRKAKGQA
jgi:hypothetical protein